MSEVKSLGATTPPASVGGGKVITGNQKDITAAVYLSPAQSSLGGTDAEVFILRVFDTYSL